MFFARSDGLLNLGIFNNSGTNTEGKNCFSIYCNTKPVKASDNVAMLVDLTVYTNEESLVVVVQHVTCQRSIELTLDGPTLDEAS